MRSENSLKYWTSGIEYNGSLMWCSNLDDYLISSQDLFFKTDGEKNQHGCVYIEAGDKYVAEMGGEDCEAKLPFICETFPQNEDEGYTSVGNSLTLIKECQVRSGLKKRDIQKMKNIDISQYSYDMKCLISCLAEKLGIIDKNLKVDTNEVNNFFDSGSNVL
ncbi:uncharacterized protein LOC132193044 [Neocloeon triangulifer]|uniref:uncharacterized protein LOC132193044 n=1 Tax=Neocloeon triangulifer TaxID=2078957 RepID=UPI00286F7EA8|nr:uncharacterized protein LOC132193044 [Neocloeon triangulifer]